jgi:hypothetical protein
MKRRGTNISKSLNEPYEIWGEVNNQVIRFRGFMSSFKDILSTGIERG